MNLLERNDRVPKLFVVPILASAFSLAAVGVVQLSSANCWIFLNGSTRTFALGIAIWSFAVLLLSLPRLGQAVVVMFGLGLLTFFRTLDVMPATVKVSTDAVGTLRLMAAQVEHERDSAANHQYPQHFTVGDRFSLNKYYRFEYVPLRTSRDQVDRYLLRASPICHCCGVEMSFTLSNDGKLYMTKENRPATTSDQML
jgi:hypothetical protein